MAVQIRRDPFARATLMREKAPDGSKCAWCGQEGRCWYYWWESDSVNGHNPSFSKPFCGVNDYEAYNG